MSCVQPTAIIPYDSSSSWVTELCTLSNASIAVTATSHDLKFLDVPTASLSSSRSLSGSSCLAALNAQEVYCASRSGTLTLIDQRSPSPAQQYKGSGKAYTSIALQPKHSVLALGTALTQGDALVELWDMKAMQLVHSYDHLHSNDVTSLNFHPSDSQSYLLLTASTDGLFSVVDARIADEDDAVMGVGNVNASIKQARWTSDCIDADVCCLTDMDTVCTFTSYEPELLHDFGNIRNVKFRRLDTNWNANYGIGFGSTGRQLFLGTDSGDFGSFDLSEKVWTPESYFERSPQIEEVVRTVVALDDSIYVSGGEDGCIGLWNASEDTKKDEEDEKAEAEAEDLDYIDVEMEAWNSTGPTRQKKDSSRFKPY